MALHTSIDPPVSKHPRHKRPPVNRVQSLRDQVFKQSELKPEYQFDLLTMFVNNELNTMIALPLFAMAIALAASFWSPAEPLIVWLLCNIAAKTVLLITCSRFPKEMNQDICLKTWRNKLVFAEFLYGSAWVGIIFVSISTNDFAAHMFLFAVIIVVLCMRMMFAASVPLIIIAGTLPMTIGLCVRFAWVNEPFYWSLAAVGLGIYCYFFFLVRGLHMNVVSMLSYKAIKDSLIAEIEEAKALSDEGRRQAEAANLAKSRFLATMSHELRTPLNAILGFSEIMNSELFGPHSNPNYKVYSQDINKSGKHLLNLINEILDLSRIEAGRYELHEEAIQLVNVADECSRLLRIRAENKGITIIEDFDPTMPKLWADERAVRQMCLNLMGNAIKFTPAKGKVKITASLLDSGTQIFSVKDNGPGIPEEEISTVLQSFGQGSLAHETAEGGTGLGLPIVRGLIHMHGGKLELKSTLRKGTEVTLVFPKNRSMLSMPALPLEAAENTHLSQVSDTGKGSDFPISSSNSNTEEDICSQHSTLELRTFIDQRINASKHPNRKKKSSEEDKSLSPSEIQA